MLFFFEFLHLTSFFLSFSSLSNLHFQDSLFKLSKPVAGGELGIVQAVPGGRWFLVPSPLLRFKRRFAAAGSGEGGESGSEGGGKGVGGVGGFNGLTGSRGTDVLIAEFDNLTRRSAISQTSYLGDGFKAGVAVDSLHVSLTFFCPRQPFFFFFPSHFSRLSLSSFSSKKKNKKTKQGLTLLARQKLRKQFLHSLAAQYNSNGGTLLVAKARPAAWASVVATALPRRRVATASAAVSPSWLGGEGRKATLTLDVTAPYGDPRGGGKRSPGLAAAGVKWSF